MLLFFEIVHRGKFEPHLEYEPMDKGRFLHLWNELRTANEHQREALKWQLASGLQDSAEFIRQQLGLDEATSSREAIEQLVEQLDAIRFADRDAAYQRLRVLAEAESDYLNELLLSTTLSPEQRARIRSVLDNVEEDGVRIAIGKHVLEIINGHLN